MPVLIWTTWQPVARMRSASLMVSWSPSMTERASSLPQVADRAFQQGRLACARGTHRFKAKILRPANQPRFRSASRLFLASTSVSRRTVVPCECECPLPCIAVTDMAVVVVMVVVIVVVMS